MQGDKAVVIGDRSLSCGHCATVCPVDAITIRELCTTSVFVFARRQQPTKQSHKSP
ncbi:MAG: 4Fe-4S binding protein [Proteobacteria bacterium]|nr:4Fe-4S binding protein [Pseudomonadota bacterium]